MKLFVLSGHGRESFAAFLNGVILQKNNVAVITAAVITAHHESALRLRSKLRYIVIFAMVTAAVITAALFFVILLHLRTRQRTHVNAPTKQTNSFCFGEISLFFHIECPLSIYKFIFILSRKS